MKAALVLLLLASPALAESEPARFGIFIGFNGDAGDKRQQLVFADDDAAQLYTQLAGGLDRAWLLTTFDSRSARAFDALTDSAVPPTTLELARVFGEASWEMRRAKKEGKRTELVLFFAGHGDVTPAGEGYLVFADGPFSRGDLATQIVEASPADVNHVWIDACASYFMVARSGSSKAVALTPSMLAAVKASPDAGAWRKTGVFVSTSDGAEVHESPDLGAGVFSFLLRSALSGAADANGDGAVEYAEAAAFVASATAAASDPRMRVKVTARAPAQRPHAPLVDVMKTGAKSYLVLDQARRHKLRVLSSSGAPYVEVHREPGETALIALVGSPYFIVQADDREAILVPRGDGAYALSALDWSDAPTGRGKVDDPRKLFDKAYGRAFVDGFVHANALLPPRDRGPVAFTFAERGQPPFRVPWGGLATGTWTVGGLLLAGAVGCAVGNATAFSALESRFNETGTLDPALALQTDAWLSGAVGLGVASIAAFASASAMTLAAMGDQ